MKVTNKPNQEGFVLVSVMLLTMVAGTVVLTSLSDSTGQERLSGNFQKKTNSRLMAEKGVYSALDSMTKSMSADNSMDLDQLISDTNGSNIVSGGSGNSTYGLEVIKLNEQDADGNDLFTVTSTGNMHEGETQLKAIYAFVPTTSSSVTNNGFDYATGIIGCNSVSVTQGGTIDSYDSSLGDYDSDTNNTDNAQIQTVLEGDTTFSGGVTIEGDLIASDNVTFPYGTVNISGNIDAVGNVTLKASGVIGGNVTTTGTYTQTNGTVSGNVSSSGNINISGGQIDGNIETTSNYTQTGRKVGGSIHSNGFAQLNNQATVGLGITSGGYIEATGGSIGGDLLASNYINLINGVDVSGSAYTHSNYTQERGKVYSIEALGDVTLKGETSISGTLAYAGKGDFSSIAHSLKDKYSDANNQNVDLVVKSVPSVENITLNSYDSDGYSSLVATCNGSAVYNDASETFTQQFDVFESYDVESLSVTSSSGGDVYLLTYSKGYFTTRDGGRNSDIQETNAASNVDFLEKNYNIIMFDDVTMNGHLTIEEGDNVTMYVAGDFTMGGAGSLTIPDNSSLTLIVEGKLTIGGGAQVYTPDSGITSTGVPVFSIFSSYISNDDGISIQGGTEEMYAVIYAPLTNVTIKSNVDFKGSVLGKTVSVLGSGVIHYDEALASAGLGGASTGGSSSSSASGGYFIFKGWEYSDATNN